MDECGCLLAKPENATGQTMWDGWMYFSGMKIERYDQRWTSVLQLLTSLLYSEFNLEGHIQTAEGSGCFYMTWFTYHNSLKMKS